ncbi:MAG: GtrA family protein [Oscillospiraceae bacterium]|nr:GtrA family protein [Oscillospiraceae bacterium]
MKFLKQLLKKALVREVIVYVFFGVLTTAVSFGAFVLFERIMDLPWAVANTLSHLLAILFAFVTNKIWVFQARDYAPRKVISEFLKFLSSRLLSYVVDMGLLALLIEVLRYDPLLSRVGTTVIIVVLNYVMSKVIVFRKKDQDEDKATDSDEV